jgi:hypothetical protein
MTIAPNNFIPPLMVSLLVWGVYRRVRRSIGRQPLQPKRLMLRIGIFGVVAVIVAFTGLSYPKVLLGFAAGFFLGVPLALVGLRLTRFETTAEGKFYTPNTHIGVALSLLFVGRLAYRMFVLHGSGFVGGQSPVGMGQSPLTLGIFGLLAGYYIVYFIGVLWHSRGVKTAAAVPPPL